MAGEIGKEQTASGARNSAAPRDSAAKDASRPLSALADRLGELEQSLTVMASEIGVSGLPQYKHLDPAKVYAEAVRQAREATSQAQAELNQRTQQASAAAAAVGARLEKELLAVVGRIDGVEARLRGLMRQLDTLHRRSEEGQQPAPSLAALHRRLEAIEQHLAKSPQRQAGPDDTLLQRLDALEARLQQPPAQPAAALETNLFVEPSSGATTDIRELQELIATELAALLARKADSGEATPLLAKGTADDINPLVMTAAERAIVRLTRRIEKLEERRQGGEARLSPTPRLGSRSGRSLMGRLFES